MSRQSVSSTGDVCVVLCYQRTLLKECTTATYLVFAYLIFKVCVGFVL